MLLLWSLFCSTLSGQPLVEGRLLGPLFLSTGDGYCTWLCLSSYQACTGLYKHTCMYRFEIQSQCHGLRNVSQISGLCWSVCILLCTRLWLVLPLLALKACFEPSSTTHLAKFGTVVDVILDSNVCLRVCAYQDWSIDLNRTLSRREKKKPSEGVTLTGISQTGSDQPVQPAKTSSR